jgi:UDP-2,3-diacylglucosamine hydrolase
MSSSSGLKCLKADEAVLFIADLHLSAEDPSAVDRFLHFVTRTAAQARALYILGDLFEAWVGDDDLELPVHCTVAAALRGLSDNGVDVFVMHGNRDFLLGDGFCRTSGARLLPDPSVVVLQGTPTLLMHGDSLCTDDRSYQQLRAQIRDPAWQQAVLARPLTERRQMARQLREQSETAKDGKSMAIMDVNATAVVEAFRSSSCQRLIHGHTHRPARHEEIVNGSVFERWVLPDWYAGGGYLRCDRDGCHLLSLND